LPNGKVRIDGVDHTWHHPGSARRDRFGKVIRNKDGFSLVKIEKCK
jgi:hypothetical protein